MQHLPEFIKYRAQCMFMVGLTLITPLATILLKCLTFDLIIEELYNRCMLLGLDILLASNGARLILETHHYLAQKEFYYASTDN